MTKFIFLCSSVILIFAFNASGFADEHFPFLAEVSKGSVNVRAGPNTNFEKVDKLNQGVQVVVLGKSFEWYKVQPLASTKEYIRSDYLKIDQAGEISMVTGNNVNIRCSPNSDAASLGEVKEGAFVKVLEQTNGWSRLEPVAGTAAWIHQDFLKQVSEDVPASQIIQAITGPSEAVAQVGSHVFSTPVSPWISMRGTVEALVVSPESDVHYELVFNDRSFYYLKDFPQISYFTNTVVDIEGAIVPDPQKKLMYPLLNINKIKLVL